MERGEGVGGGFGSAWLLKRQKQANVGITQPLQGRTDGSNGARTRQKTKTTRSREPRQSTD